MDEQNAYEGGRRVEKDKGRDTERKQGLIKTGERLNINKPIRGLKKKQTGRGLNGKKEGDTEG